jgi:phosphoheptose isomerase
MAIDWQKTVENTILENIDIQKKLLEKTSDPIIRAAKQIWITIRKGGKILL